MHRRGTEIGVELTEGESLEAKLRRVKTSGEGIGMDVGTIYTERAEGIPPETNIRTDKFDEMIEAHDKRAEQQRGVREAKIKAKIEKDNPPTSGKADDEKS